MRGPGHPNETRASALWGRGSKSDRRTKVLGRTATVLAVFVTAAIVGVTSAAAAPNGFGRPFPGSTTSHGGQTLPGSTSTPSTGTTGSTGTSGFGTPGGRFTGTPDLGKAGSNLGTGPNPWASAKTYPAGSLLARAQANPRQQFKVIVQTSGRSLETGLGRWAGGYGRLRRSFNLIDGVSMTLPGWTILYIAESPQFFGNVTITEDTPVMLADQSGPDNWQLTTGIDTFWSHLAVTCALDALGLPLDPMCQSTHAYDAPQAPAIAIVDSGIDASKAADFGGRILTRVNFASDNANGDPAGHGTMVAGIAAGSSTTGTQGGVAQNAPLVDLRVADVAGVSDTTSVIAALDWVLQNKDAYNIRVVNLSLVGNVASSMLFDPLDAAVQRLWLNGVVVVASAGNNGSATGPVGLGAPGNDPFVITVGADDTNATPAQSDDFRAPWSAYGYTSDGFIKPELSAPGRYMVAPVPLGSAILAAVPDRVVAPGYIWMSGTSFSAPLVAGMAAQLLAQHPSWLPDDVKGALMLSSTALAGDGTGMGEANLPSASAVTSPPNPNAGLDQYVAVDPATGLRTFNSDAWTTAATADPTWDAQNWAGQNWSTQNWASQNWASQNWASQNWASQNWSAQNWASQNWAAQNWAAQNWAAQSWSQATLVR